MRVAYKQHIVYLDSADTVPKIVSWRRPKVDNVL